MSKQFLQTHTLSDVHNSDIFSIAVSQQHLLSASGSNSIQIHDVKNGTTIHNDNPTEEHPFPLVQTLEKVHTLGCHHLCISREGRHAASVGFGGEVKVWSLGEDNQWSEQGVIIDKSAGEHWAPALSSDGRYLAITTFDGRINVYDTATITADSNNTPTKITQFETKGVQGMCVDISPNGEMTASGHQNGSVYIFSNSTSKLAHSLNGLVRVVREVAFSPANRYLAAAGDARLIALYDTSSGEQVANLTGHNSWVMSLSWNWSGEYLLTGAYDGKAKIWSMDRRECVATQTESDKCLWSVRWLPKAASSRNEMFVTGGADRSLSFYREASGV